jgi:hypothetical protein
MNIYVKIAFVACTAIVGSFIGWQKSNIEISTIQYETVIFATVLSSDIDSSVEEKETSSHFFSEAILGWTLAPSFKNNLGFSISSRKQERGNIIFEFTSDSENIAKNNANKFIKNLEYKLQKYNNLANTKFNILLDKPVITEKSPHKSFWTMGGGIAGFFFGLFAVELYIFLRRKK